MISVSEISKIVLASDPNEFCDRIRLLLQGKQAAKNSNLINQGIDATVDKILEYKCMSKKQHMQLLFNCSLLPEQV